MTLLPNAGDFRSFENCTPFENPVLIALTMCLMDEEKRGVITDPAEFKMPPDELPPYASIIYKRVNGLKLPILFSEAAYMAASVIAPNLGSAVVILCDCLNFLERKTVTAKILAHELYPYGFYKMDILRRIVDSEMKSGNHKWSHIYNL